MPAAVVAFAGQLLAGGFYLQLGNPAASAEAKSVSAVLTVKATGCADPANAKLSAVAIGTVDGRRQQIPLKVTKLSEPGMFAIAQQWPSSGRWVIQLIGRQGAAVTNTLVPAGPDGVDRLHAKHNQKMFSTRDVDALLD
jgi:hypothetical protein